MTMLMSYTFNLTKTGKYILPTRPSRGTPSDRHSSTRIAHGFDRMAPWFDSIAPGFDHMGRKASNATKLEILVDL